MSDHSIRAVRRGLNRQARTGRLANPANGGGASTVFLATRNPLMRIPFLGLLGLLAVCAALGLNACSESSGDSSTLPLRFSGITDSDKAQLERRARAVEAYLGKALGIEVQFVKSADYTAACNGVASNKLDLAWLGGVTSVQAEERSDGKVTLVACRASDLKFKSYFIANKEAVASGKIKRVANLADAAEMLKNCTFAFGSKASTSGRVMPQHFMEAAGIDIKTGLKGDASFVGSHTATLKAVNSGAADVGVLNYKTYDDARADAKANAEIIFTTPEYVDYCMVAHNRLGAEMLERIRDAFVGLDPANPEHRQILEAFSAKEFVAANSSDWDQIRGVLKKIDLD